MIHNFKIPISEDDKRKFEEGWTREMVSYWRERMMRLGIYDTFSLARSLSGAHRGQTIEFRFLAYGIYVAHGVGRGYKSGNRGDLDFLKNWKRTQNQHRQKRDWYHPKLNASREILGKFESAYYGDAFRVLTFESLGTMLEDL